MDAYAPPDSASGPPSARNTPLTVLIADADLARGLRVRAILEGAGDDVCAEVASAEEAVEVALRRQPDACLLHADLPGGGIWAAKLIREELEDAAVVVLTARADDDELLEALRAGACGYVPDATDPAHLPGLVRAAVDGETPVPPALVGRLIREFRARGSRSFVSLPGKRAVELTTREFEVLELLRKGLTTAEIAHRLFVSPVTVNRHVSATMQKLHVGSRDEAVRLAGGFKNVNASRSSLELTMSGEAHGRTPA